MAWFLFMDESGHDHKQTPYEVRGGFAIAEEKLWPLLQDANRLELDCFGARLADYKSEVKGSKLLKTDRFRYAAQADTIPDSERRQLCRAFLQAGLEKKSPRRDQFAAFGQASLLMADGIFDIFERYQIKVFASAVPCGAGKPSPDAPPPPEILRKDHVFLLERFFYFLEKERQRGILVMDEVEEQADRQFVRKLEKYFTGTLKGRQRATWIVPSPFFVSSNMTLPVQMADLLIYAVNWGYRRPGEMDAPVRPEIAERYGRRINGLKWKGDGYDGERTYKSFGIFCVPDLYEPRR